MEDKMKNQVYKEIAHKVTAMNNCIKSGNKEWEDKHYDRLIDIQGLLPSGSGIDAGTSVNYDHSTSDKIVLDSAYHRMDENGYYDRWIDFKVTVKPSLQFDFDIKITGSFGKHQDLKDYLYDIFDNSLRQIAEY